MLAECYFGSDFKFLSRLPCLHTLILDRNELDSHTVLPRMPSLRVLWLNHNNIGNLGKPSCLSAVL